MTEPGAPEPSPDTDAAGDPVVRREPGRRGTRRKRRSGPPVGCLVAVVVLALVVGGLYLAATRGLDALESRFGGGVEDYPGPGSGSVNVQVRTGDNASQIGETLAEEDVVASAEAFADVAATDERATGIQAGFYEMREQMSAAGALELLVDPANLTAGAVVTVPEGLRVEEILERLAEGTGVPAQRYQSLLDSGAVDLPASAGDNPEGYLFPATYEFGEDPDPQVVLQTMVDRWSQAAEQADLTDRARELGYTPAEVMTVASLIESEARRPEDRPRVARVIYNRLEGNETDGLLQLDATVNYASGEDLGARTTAEDREIDSPYNTYRNPGLPPTPIEAPGDSAIEAAANPADGGWFYYVTVDLRTGETKFAETFAEHSRNVDELNEYCATSDAC